MNDDEVKQWLTMEEWTDWDAEERYSGVDDAPFGCQTHLRTLAETRKVLWEATRGRVAETEADRETMRFLATMPRPR